MRIDMSGFDGQCAQSNTEWHYTLSDILSKSKYSNQLFGFLALVVSHDIACEVKSCGSKILKKTPKSVQISPGINRAK